MPRQILTSGQRIYALTGAEYEWFLSPQGQVTGRLPVEIELTPSREDLLQNNWAVTWHASVGAGGKLRHLPHFRKRSLGRHRAGELAAQEDPHPGG